MKIAVLGTGVVGQTLAGKLNELGHELSVGTRDVSATRGKPGSGDQGSFANWQEKHSGIELQTFSEAAAFGELIVNATGGIHSLEALKLAGDSNLAGKTLLDVANPLDFSKGFPPSLTISNTDSLAEQIQRSFPKTNVVKSLNTMSAMVMVDPKLVPGDHSVFVSGNDQSAKDEVKFILHSFGWEEQNIIDLGGISSARGVEQVLPLWVRLFASSQNPVLNFKVVWGERPGA